MEIEDNTHTHNWRSQRLADTCGKENCNPHQKEKEEGEKNSLNLKADGEGKKEQTLERQFANLVKEERDVGGGCHGSAKIRVGGGRQILIELLYVPGTMLGSDYTQLYDYTQSSRGSISDWPALCPTLPSWMSPVPPPSTITPLQSHRHPSGQALPSLSLDCSPCLPASSPKPFPAIHLLHCCQFFFSSKM